MDNNKIKLIKPMGIFNEVGTICDILKVYDDGSIVFKWKCHLGYMSKNEFKKYFEFVKIPHDKNIIFRDCLKWCQINNKLFYPSLINTLFKKDINIEKLLKIYSNRLCLKQYSNKTFIDSDFSEIEIKYKE